MAGLGRSAAYQAAHLKGMDMSSASRREPILDAYVTTMPSNQNAIDIFSNEWSSAFPADIGVQAGHAGLFEDPRISWAIAEVGGISGMSVLELGPLEGGHSYMLERSGAASVIAVEANTRAYLKCLVTKELTNLQRVQFLCGDFMEYLKSTSASFDCLIASGVLYHMSNPIELIELASKCSNRVFIWTHYYDDAVLRIRGDYKDKFTGRVLKSHNGFTAELYRFEYLSALKWSGFCGGSQQGSFWMTKGGILDCLRYFGFTHITTSFEDPNHPNGPSFALVARRL